MRRVNLDLDVLRSFTLGIELGSFAKAAGRLGRSTSAVSAQLKKLEEQAGTAIFIKAGRGLALTAAGETLLAYAHRLLALNDEAVTAVHGVMAAGWVRIGLQADVSETLLPAILGRFARTHPQVRVEVRVARNAELMEKIAQGQLDLALAWDDGEAAAHKERIAELPMHWIAARDPRWQRNGNAPVQLVAFDDVCRFRSAATGALERAGMAWQIAFSSPNLSGVWAGVAAGFGLTVRTRLGLPANLCVLNDEQDGLPALPSVALALFRKDAVAAPAAALLGAILLEEMRPLLVAHPAA